MTEPPPDNSETNPHLSTSQIDILCDAFEMQWLRGNRPQIETYISDIPEADRPCVLRQLLALDLLHRQQQGEQPASSEYCERFPQYTNLINEAWSQRSEFQSTISAVGGVDDGSDETVILPVEEAAAGLPDSLGPLQFAGQKFDDYELHHEVGRGGMGAVYAGRHCALEIPIAVKFLHPHLVTQPEAAERFLQEARLAANLDHPGIVRVFDCGQFQSHYFIVMEFIVGQNVREWMGTQQALPIHQALQVAEAVAAALENALDQVGLIHRDVKPENILMTSAGRVKLADLGLAKVLAGHQTLPPTGATSSGVVLGTPRYMSPEQFADASDIDHRSDIFSLGATLYHMLAGKPPFGGKSLKAIFQQVHQHEPAPLPAQVPAEVQELVSRMLEKRPADRYQSYEEVLGAIQGAKSGLASFAGNSAPTSNTNTEPVVIPSAQLKGRVILPAAPMENRVLLVVDIQNDFCPDGALAVPEGDQVVPIINDLSQRFSHVILTQDWHCADHLSFASAHPGKQPLEQIALPYGPQMLWPDHCVQGTHGAEFHPDLQVAHCELIIRKGFHREIDSYSAFFENDRRTPTGLAGYLRERGLTRLFVVGLATDFCVAYTALDARALGFEVTVIEAACRGIDVQGSLETTWKQMAEAGVIRA